MIIKIQWPTKKLGVDAIFPEVVHSWLKDEWHFANYDLIRESIPADLINNPDFSNGKENSKRLELLRTVRQPMIDSIPIDTEWHRIDFCKDDLGRTFIVPSADWLPLTNNSYQILEGVKNIESDFDHARKIREIKTAIDGGNVSKNLILVATSSESVFTIIEGNHRAVAFASEAMEHEDGDPIIEKIFLGISSQMKNYIWHIESRFENKK